MGKKKKNKKLEGIFRANEKGFGFIEIEEEEEDVFVSSNSVNGALNGDKVQFAIIKKKEGTKRAEGKITKILKRLTVVGALALSFIAMLPIVFGMVTDLPTSVTIGGTGLLIVVGVALETYKQIESQLVSRNYTKGRRR